MDAARVWYERAVKLSGTPQSVVLANEAAHWLDRDVLLQNGQPEKAAALAESRWEFATPNDYLVHLKLDHADAGLEIPGRRQAALQELLAIAQDYPEHFLRPLYNAAITHLEAGEFDKAVEIANTPLTRPADQEASPLEAELRSVAAEGCLQMKQFDRAAELFAELRQTGPEAYRNYWGVRQALASHLAGRHEAAIALLDEVHPLLTLPGHQAESLYVRGLCQLAKDDMAAAESSLSESLKSDRTWKQADECMLALRACNEAAKALSKRFRRSKPS